MNISKVNSFLWTGGIGIFTVVLGYYIVMSGMNLLVAGAMGVGAGIGVFAAVYLPLVTVAALFVAGIFPDILMMTPIYSEDYGALGKGLFAVDVVLLLMGIAVAINLFGEKIKLKNKSKSSQKKLGIWKYIVIFSLLIVFEIMRNAEKYGLSAPGEFRYRYMILILPIYMSLFFSSPPQRKKCFRLLIILSLFFTLIFVPVIGELNGWSVGEENRFLGATISLGLIYGLTALFLARKCRVFSFSYIFLWLTAIPVFFMVLIDGHRSVWMASTVIFLSLILLKEIRLSKMWAWGTAGLLALFIVWHLVGTTGLNVSEYIWRRGIAFLDPQADPTAGWRLELWRAQIDKFIDSPILGEGFGGYWRVYSAKLGGVVDVSPHNLYVQTLIKLGIVGMFLYGIIVIKVFIKLKSWVLDESKNNPESAIVITALVILIAAHAFYYVYAFEYYTWLFVGLGMATIKDYHNRGIRK